MLKPEAYCTGACYRAAGLVDLQDDLVEVVRNRDPLGIILGGRICNRLRLPDLIEGHTGHDVDLFALRDRLESSFKVLPDSSVEVVLDLRNRVGHIAAAAASSRCCYGMHSESYDRASSCHYSCSNRDSPDRTY